MNPEQSDALLDPYCNPEVPNDVPDRSKLINSMVIRSPRFFIFPRRAYRENRASYLRDLSLNILQTWEANWKVPTHLYDIMRHVRTSQVLISPQTLMIPAFNSFKDTWDFRWYGDLLMQAETIHDLNNIGLRFSLMDFMDEDRVIQLMENPDIPISWWADASQVSEAMNKQLGRISHSAAMPLGDLVDRFMNAHYN